MSNDNEPLVLDENHATDCHERWIRRKNRRWPDREEDIPDAWMVEQCGQCRYFIPVEGPLSTDWGVCSHAKSPFDGRVMFEHDGCDHYTGANEWVTTFLTFQQGNDEPP